MAIIRCKDDLHFYDPKKYDVCPYCRDLKGGEGAAQALDKEAVADTLLAPVIKESSRKKELPAVHNGSVLRDDTVQMAKESVSAESISERAVPAEPLIAEARVNAGEQAVTPVEEYEAHVPVAGWLVCMEGPQRGKDYRIKAGTNEIGREADSEVDIVIGGDDKISKRYHAEIQYDPEDNVFFLIQKKNEAVRLNDAKVRRPTRLNPYDIIQLGETKLVFVPLCSEKFQWTTIQ